MTTVYERVLEKLEPEEQEYINNSLGTNHRAFVALCKVIEEELSKTNFLSEEDLKL